MTGYVVVYGRFVDDKQDGVFLEGTYFGGVAKDKEGADEIAKQCANNAKRGASFPRIIPLERPEEFQAVIVEAVSKFDKQEAQMWEAEAVHQRNQDVAKRRRTK